MTNQRSLRPSHFVNESLDINSSLPCEQSDEDLFYLLIDKIKKREQAEAAAVALQEEIERKLKEVNQENEILKDRLSQSEVRHEAQETENVAQRNLIERWKTKFNKLRDLVTIIGNDHEVLRKDGQLLKSAQTALLKGKHHLQAELSQLNDNINQMNRFITQQQTQLASVQSEFVILEQSLLISDNNLKISEKSLAREMNRTATLESFIRNHSNKALKQLALFQQDHSETISRIEKCYESINLTIANSQSAIKSELGVSLKGCLDMLVALSTRESMEPAALAKIDSALQSISARLDTESQMATQHLTNGFDKQSQQSFAIIQQLSDIDASFKSSFEAASKLAEAKEAHGILQEKVRTVETALTQANIENTKLKEREIHLCSNVKSLQGEVELLRGKLADSSRSGKDALELSKMQIQFETTVAALNETRDNLHAKEAEMAKLAAALDQTKENLENAEMRISTLETEKTKLEEDAKVIENRLRVEYTRASLLSKEQNRAWFEQQLHQVKREKDAVEKSTETFKEQLEALKLKLVAENKREIEDLREIHRKEIASVDEEISKLKEERVSEINDTAIIRSNLENALAENERLKTELSEARSMMENSRQISLLQEKVDLMRGECTQKDENFTSLANKLVALYGNAKEIERFRAEGIKEAEELKNLRKKLDDMENSNAELASLLKHRDDDVACLTAELELSKENDTASNLKQVIQDKDDELQKLQGRLQGIEHSVTKIESLLQEFKLLEANEQLLESWNLLEKRLEAFTHRVEPSEMLLDTDADEVVGEVPSQGPKHIGKRKRTLNLTPDTKRKVSPLGPTCEYKTTKVVYRKESIRRSISCSPLKTPTLKHPVHQKRQSKVALRRIKPFSEIQLNFHRKPGSPSDKIGDLDNLLSVPKKEGSKATVPSTPKVHEDGNKSATLLQLPRSPVKNIKVESHMMQREHTGETFHGLQGEQVSTQEENLKPLSQIGQEKALPKTIFKDTMLPRLTGNEIENTHTLLKEEAGKIKGAVLSGAPTYQPYTSRFFKSSGPLSNSQPTWAISQSTSTAVGYGRPRRYGKKKGE
ncbi:hypothetical protein PRK78_003620 [Emydomyces testavorans]|uniref:Uncharacterized protein n=1 Tax=Emydomyces testavorans TaxID=2070801 RepID=A0AAF0IIJ0_9EURO|nr:hypothetical protein PRK78_003620 [Emydomyces testavorans]